MFIVCLLCVFMCVGSFVFLSCVCLILSCFLHAISCVCLCCLICVLCVCVLCFCCWFGVLVSCLCFRFFWGGYLRCLFGDCIVVYGLFRVFD